MTDVSAEETAVKRPFGPPCVARSCRCSMLLSGACRPGILADLEQITVIITDEAHRPDMVRQVRDAGVQVVIAETT